jgi:protein SCO1/2
VGAEKGQFSVEKILLFCYHYDPKAGSYAATASRMMSIAGFLTVLIGGLLLWRMFKYEKHRKMNEPFTAMKEH